MRVRYLRMELANWVCAAEYRRNPAGRRTPHLVKRRLLRELAGSFNIRCLIETGTYFGEMIAGVAHSFDEVHSIELSQHYYQLARKRFANRPAIFLYHGDSATVLPQVLSQCHRPTLFWLDAHFSGGDTAAGTQTTPVLSELHSIMDHDVIGHVVLIDDADLFTGKHGYPTIDKIRRLVATGRSAYDVRVAQDIIRITPRR